MGRNTISQLSDKRRRLHGELLSVQKGMLKLKADIAALDHSLMIMGYEGIPCDLPPIKAPKRLFENKELPRLIARIHRERPDLPTDILIAAEIILRKGWCNSDAALLEQVQKKVHDSRRRVFSRGLYSTHSR